MKRHFSMLAATIMTLLMVTAAASAQQAKPQPQSMQGHDMSKMQGQNIKDQSAGSMELHKTMMSGQEMPMTMTGDVDRDFATMMTAHHQQAIKMVDVLLKYGKNAQLKAMATKMKADQQQEVKELAPFTK